jgi:hypothetical protein
MLFYGACLFLGYLFQRYVKGWKAYLLAPIGAALSSIGSILIGAFVIAPIVGGEIDPGKTIVAGFLHAFWGSFLVAFAIWFYRRRKEKAADESKNVDHVS